MQHYSEAYIEINSHIERHQVKVGESGPRVLLINTVHDNLSGPHETEVTLCRTNDLSCNMRVKLPPSLPLTEMLMLMIL